MLNRDSIVEWLENATKVEWTKLWKILAGTGTVGVSLEITSFMAVLGDSIWVSLTPWNKKLELYFVSQLCALCYEVAPTVLC